MRGRDAHLLEMFVKEYNSHLIHTAKGMDFSSEQTQDICHQTWISFIESIDRFEGRSHLRTYLFGIFYNKCKELRRTNLKFESHDEIDHIVDAQFDERGHWNHRFSDPVSAYEQNELNQQLNDCIAKLNDLMKQVFWLKEVEQFESEEICHILNISNTNLRQLLSRSKNRLRECLSKKLGNGHEEK
ncbi:MAG: RNA polymerase factor sigma-70 [Bdellovibrio sp.]